MLYILSSGKTIKEPKSKIWVIMLSITLITIFSFLFIEINTKIIKVEELWIVLEKMFQPKVGQTWADYFAFILTLGDELLDTLQMSFAGTLIGAALAIPISILAAQNIVKTPIIYQPIRFIMNFIRAIPTMILAILATFFVGLGILPGIISIAIFSFGIMVKMLYEGIETIDMSPFESLESTGATKAVAFRYSAIPQIAPIIISYTVYIFEINIRASAVLGYVGAGGIGSVIKDNVIYNYDRVGATIILMLVVILVVQFFSNYLRRKLQ